GALNETHAILQRMRELAVQSANDTYTEVDRSEIQKEIDQLSQELSRIGSTTEFNTQKLLNGNFKGTFHIGANENQSLSLEVGDMRGFALGMAGEVKIKPTADASEMTHFVDGTYTVKAADGGGYELVDKDGNAIATSDDGKEFTSTGEPSETLTFTAAVTTGTVTIDQGTASAVVTVTNAGLEAGSYTYVEAENALKDANGNVVAKSTDGATFTTLDGSKDLVTFSAALTDGVKFEVGGIDVSSQTSANGAITRIQTAIETVSAERSKLGAYQNRLEHTINNLGASSENLTAAESRIRDVDMAKEMMEFTRANILSQAAQAMLAQANQLPQGVLQLLR
ncbi:MAG: flagellin, partial [Bacillota bacterium]